MEQVLTDRPTSFQKARPGPSLPPELVERGRTAEGLEPGDFVLVATKRAGGFVIRLGQKLRIHGEDRKYVKWTHAAVVADADGTLIEAVGTGVREYPLKKYDKLEYLVVRIVASPENRAEIVDFARWALQRKCKYNNLATVSIGLSMLTGSKLAFYIDGRFVCSGLVARALERTGRIFDRDPSHIAPADLAKYYAVGTVHTEAPAAA
ncbi:MAG: Permuted papain-like amidase enzyme YaeF/YiiX, family [Pseudonocardia sp.]|jgi:uncharacterized protein YycO|nr:Permuted papain-like amidase enzyme YaeF/YiiX, family [Pseudonocardia sp.]